MSWHHGGVTNPSRVFIVGCAGSGTTLLRRLFFAIEGTTVVPEQISALKFIDMDHPGGILVGKRGARCPMAGRIDDDEARRQLTALCELDTAVIHIVRNGLDTVSGHQQPRPQKWAAAISQSRRLSQFVALEVRYEHLVRDPDDVQREVCGALCLTPTAPWSEYPAFVPGSDKLPNFALTMRPITTERISKPESQTAWIDACQDAAEEEQFRSAMAALGYKMGGE